MQLLPDVIRRRVRRPSPAMAVAFVALFAAVAGGAYAAGQINGASIKNNTIGQAKFTPPTRAKLNHNVGAHWGVIDRNTIGSGIADLRSGPYGSFGVTGAAAKPPFGTGSLGIQVSGNATSQSPAAEKVAFGNEVDFYNQQVANLMKVGYRTFQTGEDAAISPQNLPNITLEINPHVGSSTYTSMTWIPPAAPVTNRWTGFMDATTTGQWYFTGSAGTTTGCNQATTCSFSAAKAALVTFNNGSPATIDTVAVAKGRDNDYSGAVDGLRVNNTVYDFEAYGVVAKTSP